MKTFRKRIAKPGYYSVANKDGSRRRERISKERIQKWKDNFDAMKALGLNVPAPFYHDDRAVPDKVRTFGKKDDHDSFNNGGFWNKLTVDKHGALWGEVEVDDEALKKLNKTIKDVSILAKPKWEDGDGHTFEDCPTHIALVLHPVIKDGTPFVPVQDEQAIALSLDSYIGEEGDEFIAADGVPNENADGDDGAGKVNASSANVQTVIKMMQQLDPPIRLPDDTTGDNFLERMSTALAAVLALKQGEGEDDRKISEPPGGSKEQPGPVAMSIESDFALQMLAKSNINNPATGRPWTAAELSAAASKKNAPTVEVALSLEDQATINFARKQVAKTYVSRLEACVQKGQITPKTAKEFQKDFLGQDLQLAFDSEGTPVDGPADKVLKAYEAIPPGSVLHGAPQSQTKGVRGSIFSQSAFSIGAGVTEEEPPAVEGDDMPLSETDADQIVNMQLRNSGFREDRVDGGLKLVGAK